MLSDVVAQAASCGISAAGIVQWKIEFAGTARAAGVRQKGLAALAGANYTIGTIRADRAALSARSVGAMHGEIGHTQFLPGNVLKYGVGSRNLRDKSTALMSTANFLKAHGWQAGRGYQDNMGAIAGWNAASVYQQAIARIGAAIDGN